jgi:hypothetical protein
MNEVINKLDQHLKNVYEHYYYDNTRSKTEYMKSTKGDDSGKPSWVLSAIRDQQIIFIDFGPTIAVKKEYSDKSKGVIIEILKSYDQNLTNKKFQEIITRL